MCCLVLNIGFYSVPSRPPINVTGSALNSTHIFISWEPPPHEHINGIIDEYRVYIIEQESEVVFQLETTDTNTTIGNLHPHYTYNCTVVAVTIGEGPSFSIIIRTNEDGELNS